MKTVKIVLLSLAAALGLYLLIQALVVTDAKRIRRIIEKARRSVVRYDLEGVMSCVDRTYEDDFGMDYERLDRWFQGLFTKYDSLVCMLPVVSVKVYRTEAVCTLLVWFAAYSKGRKTEPPEAGPVEGYPVYQDRLVVYLNRFPEGWLVTGAGQ